MTDRKIFGLVVRLVGIVMVTYYGLGYMQGALSCYLHFSKAAEGYSPTAYLVPGAAALIAGVLLVRGEWLVRFAYGRES
jgi:UPF0716 family protein affecting phage T7 exclusion